MKNFDFKKAGLLLAGCIFSTVLFSQSVVRADGKFVSSFAFFSPTDGLIYSATLNDSPVQFDATMKMIDPKTGATVGAFPIQPLSGGILGLSLDGERLFSAQKDTVIVFNLTSKTVEKTFLANLPFDVTGGAAIELAGGSLAMNWFEANGSQTLHLAVYDNGVRRPLFTTEYRLGQLSASVDGRFLYAYDYFSTGAHVAPIEISAAGARLLPARFKGLKEFMPGQIFYENRLYGHDGSVFSIEKDSTLRLLARLTESGTPLKWGAGSDTIFYQKAEAEAVFLLKYHKTNFQLLEKKELLRLPKGKEVSRFFMLDRPENVAAFSDQQQELFIHQKCSPALAAPPALAESVFYRCGADSLWLEAPDLGFSDTRYFWSDFRKGRTRAITEGDGGKYSYRIADSNGCLSAPSPPAEVVNIQKPPLPQVFFPFSCDAICTGGGSVLAEGMPFFPQATTAFLWSNGDTTRRARFTTTGTKWLRTRSIEGCWSEKATFLVNSNNAPTPPKPVLTIKGGDGDATVCAADAATIEAPAGFLNYFWTDGFDAMQRKRGPIGGSKTFQLAVLTNAGCSSELSDPVDIQFFPTPPQPTISKAAGLLASSAASGNQWFVDEQPISGATGQFFAPTVAGRYSVQVGSNSPCPSPMSDAVDF